MKITISIILFLLYYNNVKNKQISIEKIISSGDGLGFIDGKAHFVPGTLPGEKVEIIIIEEKKGFNKCSIEQIVQESEYRVEPFCKYYKVCGGCNLQITDYSNQLQIKKDILKDIFLRNGKIILEEFNILSSMDRGYRNRVQFHKVKDSWGFKKNMSNEVVKIENCPVLVEGLNTFLENDHKSSKNRVTIFSPTKEFFIGDVDDICTVKILDKDISFNPNGFFQSNLEMVPKIIELVNRYVIGTDVMDLFCGIGLFSAFLPDSVKHVIGVEMDVKVKEFVEKNLSHRNFSFYPMSLEHYISKGFHDINEIDTIIIDPPRKGLSPDVREFLSKSKVKRIIYISCDPTTMARDISELKCSGYSLMFFEALDFYPQTTHIESFGVLDLA